MAENDELPKSGQSQPEPEGGPYSRSNAFMEDRFTPLRRKGEGGDGGAERTIEPKHPSHEPSIDSASNKTGAQPPSAPVAIGKPAQSRKDTIRRYRERQRRDIIDPKGSRPSGAQSGPQAPQAPNLTPGANNWVPIGPSVLREGQGATFPSTSGRTPAIAVAPGGERVYIAAANGGVWRSEDTGKTWTSLMDAFDLNPSQIGADSLACGAIALVPGETADVDRIYVGSGEGAGGAYFGVGPIVSTDGGANWVTEEVAPGDPDLAGSAFYALAVDPVNSDRVVGAARGDASGNLIYRREANGSGGFHWARKSLPGSSVNWITSVVVARAGGATTFFAAPWFGPIYSSNDGDTWSVAGSDFPSADVGRIALAVQPNNPNTVYALIHNSADNSALGVWRLDVADNAWHQVTGHPPFLCGNPDPAVSPGTQGSYDLAIAVDPNDVNQIYLGGSTVLSAGEWSGSIDRCVVSFSGAGPTLAYSMTTTYIGASTHADIHTFAFAPGDSDKLWVGCDGGVFYSTNPSSADSVFESRNTGLATLTLEHLDQHPTEDAVLFSGSQDNGGQRFTGEEAWLHTVWGDSGHFVVNWADPYKVIATYVFSSINRSVDGGTRYNYSSVGIALSPGESVLFYAPLVGTPYNPGNPAEADIVAFGSTRPWISTTFGGGWQSIPNGTLVGDQLDERIRAMVFASATKLYAGTMSGSVYRFDNTGGVWSRTQIDTLGGAASLVLTGVVTDIAVDPADVTGNSIYITMGGFGDFRHVWHFDGSVWQQRSGTAAGNPNSLLDVQHNAIVVDPTNPEHVYVGADIGTWRSTDAGATWTVFSEGLPDAAVIDLKLHNPRRLLRVSTHGRGAFERKLDLLPKPAIELYVRDTQLDQGRFPTVNWLDDPVEQGELVRHWRGPDIKLDTPDFGGDYQFPLAGTIDFHDFTSELSDDFRNVATNALAITTRVYAQIHNRGVMVADDVQVMCLLANASAGLPALPVGYEADVASGTPINTADWKTIGIHSINGIKVGFPKIAAFNLSSADLPPPASLVGNEHHCVLILVHHAGDSYSSAITNTDNNSRQVRKAAHKNLRVVNFTGALPSPPPVVVPFRIHSSQLNKKTLNDLVIRLRGYRGRVRLVLPKLNFEGKFSESFSGLFRDKNLKDFETWAEAQRKFISDNLDGKKKYRYDKTWSKQRLQDISAALDAKRLLEFGGKDRAVLQRIILPGKEHQTLFLLLDRPLQGRIGERFDVSIEQRDSQTQAVVGGMDLNVDLVPTPKKKALLAAAKTRSASALV